MKVLIISLIILIAVVVFILIMRKPKIVDKSLATYEGPLADYSGEKKLIAAFTASWASVWKLTEQELKKLDFTSFDLCILDQAIDKDEIRNYGINILPTVALVKDGEIIKKVQNMNSIDQIKEW